ncbi:hypothetical protein BKH45_03825 [Helicobacter sp. 11S03491-1]|nr:hypothetical protein BKH45_03825 [Helicobacter sp. 11S03491-1]
MINNRDVVIKQSALSFQETLSNLKNVLHQKNITIFAIFDHTKNAHGVNLELNPTTVVVFGTPEVGTKLMQKNQKIAIELPVKILIWQDEKGVFVEFLNFETIAKNYGFKDNVTIKNVEKLLSDITDTITKKH